MRKFVFLVIVQMEFDFIALANADETPRHIPSKGPEYVIDAIGQAFG